MINPLLLRTFVRLVETGHFTRTAEALYMTQPGVTQHIKKLEAQLGQPLLNRHGKQFELTPAGESLYRYALEQQRAEQALREQLDDDSAEQGAIRIACSGAMALQIYPRLLDLQHQYPRLSVSIEAAPNQRIEQQLRTNEIDLGLLTQPLSDPSLSQHPIGQDSLCLILPADHASDWDSLLKLGFINHPDGHHYAIQLLEANYPDQFTGMAALPQAGYINQLGQILLPVAEGLGFTVLPQSAVNAFSQPERLAVAPLAQPVQEPIYLTRKKHRPLPARYTRVEQLLHAIWR
ncbi:LysR family transcriptional regulator [Motiliproteus sediminis]|uniref:LysR family transcriptional regulator n=1 Tax=Motiliproteus sediminis TaxID=1468178 RepID=UPI001AEFAD21|nr:LysR family transcriptional regulator [Motiliproteus sediminis]